MQDLHKDKRLTERVANILREEIQRARPGDRIESFRGLAKRFSVSKVTVSEALLILSQEGLIHKRHGSGTYVADRSFRQHVGILIEEDISHPRSSYFFRRLVQQVRAHLESQKFRVTLYIGRLQPGEQPKELTCREFLEDVTHGKLYGAVIAAAAPFPEWMDQLKRQQIPFVGGMEECPYGVACDIPDMIRQGARYLLERGRRRIALLGWKSPLGSKGQGEQRIRAFKEALEEFGASFCEEWVRWDLHPSLSGAGWAMFREVWSGRAKKPDGILLCDDMLFQDVGTAILELGIRVPDQLWVVTHANKGSGIFHPFPVTRMEFDPDRFAQAMSEMLLKVLRKEPVERRKVVVPFRWVEKEAVIREFSNAEYRMPNERQGSEVSDQ